MKLGLIGEHISYTLSPKIHQFSAQCLGFTCDYEILDTPQHSLEEKLNNFFDSGGIGLNVTTPHKKTIAKLLNCGQNSVNTIYRDNGRLLAASTDGAGFCNAVSHLGNQISEFERIVFIGFGGAALGILSYLSEQGYRGEVHIHKRTPLTSREIENLGANCRLFSHPFTLLSMKESVRRDLTLLVQATNAPHRGDSLSAFTPIFDNFSGSFVDLVYGGHSALLERAKELSIPHQDGIPMLIEQARGSQTLWWGKAAPYQDIKDFLNVA